MKFHRFPKSLTLLSSAVILSAPFVLPLAAQEQARTAAPTVEETELRASVVPVTEAEMKLLAPDSGDIQGFYCVDPSRIGKPEEVLSPARGRVTQPAPARVHPDQFGLNEYHAKDPYYFTEKGGIVSLMDRHLWSQDGAYHLMLRFELCDSQDTAVTELKSILFGSSGIHRPGTFSGSEPLGEESWVLGDATTNFKHLTCRYGKLVLSVSGDSPADPEGPSQFPMEAVDSIAYQILLNGARHSDLTAIPNDAPLVTVNGHDMAKTNVVEVAGKVYVPAVEFAKSLDLKTLWDAKTGKLTLSGGKASSVSLLAGSTKVTSKGGADTKLKSPVMKEGGQVLVALDDLVRLAKASSTQGKGHIEVKA